MDLLVGLHDGVLLLPAAPEEQHQEEVGREHDHGTDEADEDLLGYIILIIIAIIIDR